MLDHLLALTFAVGFPLVNIPLYARRRPLLQAGDSATRRREHWETILWLGGMGVATVVVWFVEGRDLAALGLGVSGSWQFQAGLGLAALGSALLFLQVRGIRRDPRAREAAREALEHVREYLPSTREELRLFRGVSVSAGVGEELFYRGFLLWYLGQYLALPWAVVAGSILFGTAHVMHGWQAAARSTVTGALLALLYLFTGALWAPMLLHTAIDLSSGEMGMAAYGAESTEGT